MAYRKSVAGTVGARQTVVTLVISVSSSDLLCTLFAIIATPTT